MCSALAHVCFVPEADILSRAGLKGRSPNLAAGASRAFALKGANRTTRPARLETSMSLKARWERHYIFTSNLFELV